MKNKETPKDKFDIAQEAFENSEIVLCPNKFCYNYSEVAGCQMDFENLEEECDTYNLYNESVPAETLVSQAAPQAVLLADIPNIIGLLENCKYKLRLYKADHPGEYIGGTEYTEFIKQINDMQQKLSKQSG